METHIYHVDVYWKGGRLGIVASPEVNTQHISRAGIEFATPPEFPGGIPGIWSPEHLFTASVAACLMTTFLAIAEKSNLKFFYFVCHATGKLEEKDGTLVISEIQLSPVVSIHEEKNSDKTYRILEKAKQACLISNSIKSTVRMTPLVDTVPPVDAPQPASKLKFAPH